MSDNVDIFRVESDGVRWLQSAATLECARVRVEELAMDWPGEYIVLDQTTGNKHVIKLAGMQELSQKNPRMPEEVGQKPLD